ncbi:hypothetical protein HN51_028615, partial [Arachis hypogaea]
RYRDLFLPDAPNAYETNLDLTQHFSVSAPQTKPIESDDLLEFVAAAMKADPLDDFPVWDDESEKDS